MGEHRGSSLQSERSLFVETPPRAGRLFFASHASALPQPKAQASLRTPHVRCVRAFWREGRALARPQDVPARLTRKTTGRGGTRPSRASARCAGASHAQDHRLRRNSTLPHRIVGATRRVAATNASRISPFVLHKPGDRRSRSCERRHACFCSCRLA